MAPLEINGDAYIGAVRIVNGAPERWIGMFFPQDTAVPDGFDHVDIEPMPYAVFYLYGNADNGELFGPEPHNLCLADLKARGLKRKEDDWCFERCNCPRFTTPDTQGNVILDYAVAIEAE